MTYLFLDSTDFEKMADLHIVYNIKYSLFTLMQKVLDVKVHS